MPAHSSSANSYQNKSMDPAQARRACCVGGLACPLIDGARRPRTTAVRLKRCGSKSTPRFARGSRPDRVRLLCRRTKPRVPVATGWPARSKPPGACGFRGGLSVAPRSCRRMICPRPPGAPQRSPVAVQQPGSRRPSASVAQHNWHTARDNSAHYHPCIAKAHDAGFFGEV